MSLPPLPPIDPRAGEARRLLQPLLDVLNRAIRFAPWVVFLLFLGYLASGITTVKPGEVAFVLRFGKLVGENRALAIREPGLLLTFPRPIDEVIRVETQKIHSIALSELMPRDDVLEPMPTLDPEREGYCLTADKNIVHFESVVQYRVADPIAYALNQVEPETLLRDAVYAAFTRSAGEIGIDSVFKSDRFAFGRAVRERAEDRLVAVDSGLEIVSLEVVLFYPPPQVYDAFADYRDAFVERVQTIEEGNTYRASELPAAKGRAARILGDALQFADRRVETAKGQAKAFRALAAQYEAAPNVVRDRLYAEWVKRALPKIRRFRLVQPPALDRYEGFRITIPAR